LSRLEPTRYHKISHDAAAIEGLFLDAHSAPPPQIILDLGTRERRRLERRYLFTGGTGMPAIFTPTAPRWLRLVK
jgi:hypothetical protein